MRLSLILPPVEPEVYPALERCPYPGCGGRRYDLEEGASPPSVLI
jgi:hypothetical protein